MNQKSDVYQLGLLFAEMFSGTNPQRPVTTGDFAESIELRGFFVQGGLGKPLKDLILSMLDTDPVKRPSAAELIFPWQSLFIEARDAREIWRATSFNVAAKYDLQRVSCSREQQPRSGPA